MDELQAILDEWRNGEVAGNGVLATVVHVKGSAYRRPGARMLILPGGRRIGSVSGGCLEGEVTRKAWWHTESGEPSLRVYDTSSSDEAVWEFGNIALTSRLQELFRCPLMSPVAPGPWPVD